MIDLHCHTKISDNSMTTEEVLKIAAARGVTHLAITDHDTTIGLREAERLGRVYGVEVIPGIEISAYDHRRKSRAHILGFFVTQGHEAIDKLCGSLREERHQTSFQMVQQIMAAGYNITWEEVIEYASGGTGVYKQHIMHALLDKGYTDRIYGELYKTLFYRGSETRAPGIAFVPITYVDVKNAILAIKDAGGIPVLAHPGQFNSFDAVEEWVEAGLEGIEVEHPLHSHEDKTKALELADRLNLVKTGGSDFHGFYSDADTSIGDYVTKVEWYEELKKRKTRLEV
ncbi:PHP domain-containing protein [Bacillus salitolerans]|uniref:PHP domain-containing protein n=1 Tax=Bacillus salitolerans TaxID=1437434 RepID=A0ABW4LJ74_9BACI